MHFISCRISYTTGIDTNVAYLDFILPAKSFIEKLQLNNESTENDTMIASDETSRLSNQLVSDTESIYPSLVSSFDMFDEYTQAMLNRLLRGTLQNTSHPALALAMYVVKPSISQAWTVML